MQNYGGSMSKENTNPETWQQQEGFILKASWFYNKKTKNEQPKPNEDDFIVKIVGHPNWRFNFSALHSLHRSFDDALLATKTFFKHSDFAANQFYIPPKDEAAPINFSKKQRVKLIDQIMNGPKEAKAESSGLLRTAFLDNGEDALWVTIEETSYADEIEREFTNEDSPLHSLVNKECSAYINYYIDDEKLLEKQKEYFSEEELATIKQYLTKKKPYRGKKTVRGPLKIEEGVLSIGSWSYRFQGDPEKTEEGSEEEKGTKEEGDKELTDGESGSETGEETKREATNKKGEGKKSGKGKGKDDSEEVIKIKGFPFLQATVRAKNIGLLIRAIPEGA